MSLAGCQTLRMAASRRAKALGVDAKNVRMPRCNKMGGFEPIQCDNEIISSCWCVDEAGFELAGTRAPAATLVNCTGKDFEVFRGTWPPVFLSSLYYQVPVLIFM